MKKHELIITDIDGTLLNIDYVVAPETIEEIQRVWKMYQIPTVLASGRMSRAMQHIKRKIGLPQFPMISYNGALVQADLNADGYAETLFSKTFSAEEAIQIYNLGMKGKVEVGLYSYDDWLVERVEQWIEREIVHVKIEPDITNHRNVLQHWQETERGLHKIMLIGATESINRLEQKIRTIFDARLKIYRSNPYIIEVCPNGVTKQSGVEFLSKYLNIIPENILALGDNMNDKAMLEYVGMGIAVGNAKSEVKAIANDITATNLELGVAKALKKYF
jgi:Cof subfamily protein (haloacid dehalogenase superfamily)